MMQMEPCEGLEMKPASAVGGPGQQACHDQLARLVGVTRRFLRDDERPYVSQDASVPVVIEANGNPRRSFLEGLLRESEKEVMHALHVHGALLLRGFDIDSDEAFESVITTLKAMRPMGGYFMAEEGRTVVNSRSKVFHTNKNRRTGGSFSRAGAGYHTENHYSIDTPAYLCFWCKKQPWFGGETALSHLARAYAELDDELRARLERECVSTVKIWPVERVAESYGAPAASIEAFFSARGLPIVEVDSQRCIVLEKPPVVRHPYWGWPSAQTNVGGELRGFDTELARRFDPHYATWPWLLHRAAWKSPLLRASLVALVTLPLLATAPSVTTHYLRAGWRRLARSKRGQALARPRRSATPGERLTEKLRDADVLALAARVWRHSSVFSWRRGDVLILDNVQMLHAGMPGFGPRELRAMLCNAMALRYPLTGIGEFESGPHHVSVHDQLQRMSRASSQV